MTTTPTFWGTKITFSPFPGDFAPQVRALTDDTFAIVWERDGVDIVGRHFDELGSFTGGDFLSALSGSTAKPLSRPQIFEQTDGRVVVNYTEAFAAGDRDIHWHSPNETFTPPHAGSFPTESMSTNGPSTDEVLLDSTARVDGGAANVFQFTDFGSTDIVLRFTDATGNQASNRIFVGPHAGQVQQNPALAALHTGFVVVAYENFNPATSARDIRFHTYAPNENDVSGEVTASTSVVNAGFPDITALRDGSFVVAWQQADGIAFQHFIGNGTPTGPTPLLVPNSSSGLLPKIAALNDGGFIITWTGIDSTESDGSPELEVFLQRFDVSGNTIGTRVQIDEPGDQGFGKSIATLDDGRVILAYESETGDSTNVTTLDYRIVDPREATILGTNGDDNIIGREDGSLVSGLDGNDKLTGREASDTLAGGLGNDVMNGSGGKDTLNGETGDDIYDFNATSDSAAGASRDIIENFVFEGVGTGDKIDVSTIDANVDLAGDQAFTFIGTTLLTGAGQIRVFDGSSENTLIQLSTDSDPDPESEIEVKDGTVLAASWTYDDFFV